MQMPLRSAIYVGGDQQGFPYILNEYCKYAYIEFYIKLSVFFIIKLIHINKLSPIDQFIFETPQKSYLILHF